VGREVTGGPGALGLHGVSKAYGPTQALDGVSFEVAQGTVHALLGGNGCGKSTLIKILAGVVEADAGELEVRGGRHDARDVTPSVARQLGFRFVHQQPTTFADMSVADNLAIGHGFVTGAGRRVQWREQRAHAAATLERFGIDAKPSQALGSLTPARQTMVAVARALQDQQDASDGILVLDEPTAALPAGEVHLLLDALRGYAGHGQTILYVSHRLDEVLAVADAATVLRDGAVKTTSPRAALTHDRLVELIVGRALEAAVATTAARPRDATILEVRNLRSAAVRDAGFVLREGEVLGVAGLLGSGRSTLLRALFGAVPLERGELRLAGQPLLLQGPRDAMAAGIAYVPEDRISEGAFGDLSVDENLSMATVGTYWRRGRLRHRDARGDARGLMRRYGIRAASERAPLASLSGGNQQKVMLARWMRRSPRVLLLDEPTQGVDVGARAEIYGLVRRAVDAGTGIILVSSDAEELALLCDRALILRRGVIVDEVERPHITDSGLEQLLLETEAVPS